MNVFINGRFATQPFSGVQRYAAEIVRALDRQAGTGSGQRFVLLSPRGAPSAGLTNIPQRWIGRVDGHLWDQWHFSRASRRGVAMSLAMSGPIAHPRQLVVIHDAAVHRRPEHFSRPYRLAHQFLERRLARRATIATVSNFSARELAAVLRLPKSSVVLAPNGADHAYVAPDTRIVERLGLQETPFFLTVGNLTSNKNLSVVLRALGRSADPGFRVVMVGQQLPTIFGATALGGDPRLILAGRLSDAEVGGLMRSARSLIFPSRYEGFGLPLLEAMASDCPVLSSSCEAAVEVCAGAAEHFDPDDDARLADLMQLALADDGRWRRDRIVAGRMRAEQYRWADSAAVLAEACVALAA